MSTFQGGTAYDTYTLAPAGVGIPAKITDYFTGAVLTPDEPVKTTKNGAYRTFRISTTSGYEVHVVWVEFPGVEPQLQVSVEQQASAGLSGRLTGSVPTEAELPDVGTLGDAYVTEDDLDLYVWTQNGGFVRVGSMRGPGATDADIASILAAEESQANAAARTLAQQVVGLIAPENDARAVGKDEIARNMLDHGVKGDGVTDDTAAINDNLAQGGHWLFPGDRTYKITGPIRGTKSQTVVETRAGTVFEVFVGYAGDVLLIGDTLTQIIKLKFLGPAQVREPGKSGGASTVPGSWTFVHFFGNQTGVTDVEVEWEAFWPHRRAYYETTGLGWVNGTRITGNSWYPRVMLECNKNGSSAVGFAGNTWTDIVSQCGQHTTHVTKGLTGRGWTFKDVSPWDIGHNPAAVSLDVDADAKSIVIIGGLMTTQNVQNRAASGEVTIIDQSTLPPWSTRAVVGASGMIADTTHPASPTLVRRTQVLCWQLADGVISGNAFSLQVPPRATKATVVLHMAGVGGVSGSVRMAVVLASAAGAGTSLTAPFTTTLVTAPMGADDVIVEVPLPERVTVPGQVLSVRPYRIGTDAADTYAGPVVLTAVTTNYRT
ncbi:hypothetical protein [Serinicoccus sediminis]|uniref:hypothetical protein n=1 Tax=Serinicoccus sediminis TaxID=2306021 RepID=UPI001020D505|nr:hypothetical protein [Serinicoccus sediminis]